MTDTFALTPLLNIGKDELHVLLFEFKR